MQGSPPEQNVLFLCTGNYYRSRFAEFYFRHLAAQRGLAWKADSRGLALDPYNLGPMSVHTIHELTDRAIPFDTLRLPIDLAIPDLERSHLVIAVKEAEHRPLMRRRFPEWEHKVEYWDVHDLDVEGPQQALPILSQLVERLVERLRVGC